MTAERLSLIALTFMAAVLPSAARAQQHDEHAQPYAGLEDRQIKSLSADEIEALLAGEGMGFALSAELNGYPGPRHVLELAEPLALTDEQRDAVQSIFDRMQTGARALGEEIVEMERELDESFRAGALDPSGLEARLGAWGRAWGRLRAVHLRAHLEVVEHLSEHQIHTYVRLRGYGGDGGSQGSAGS